MSRSKDIAVLRDLCKQVADIAAKPIQDERRELWRKHNALIRTRPLVIITGVFCWDEISLEQQLQCEDPLYRSYERVFRKRIYQDTWNDDTVIEPWIKVRATYSTPDDDRRWGPEIKYIPTTEPGGSWMFDPAIKDYRDLEKLVAYHHLIDEETTDRNVARIQEAIGDILEVTLSRAPVLTGWRADISTDLARLRGLEQIMWDMVDNPQLLHRLCSFMRHAVLQQQDEAEGAGDWGLCDHDNQSVPYSSDLPDPSSNGGAVKRDRLWVFVAAQEMAQVSPQMHEEFILQYQMPIMEKFGLVAYGCCEDLTNKIDMLRKIKNLRRIGVTPFADVRRCAEQIQQDYVFSWRPSPAEMICNSFKPDRVRKIVREAMEAARGCHVDITLKDVQTVKGKFENITEWVKVVRDVADNYA